LKTTNCVKAIGVGLVKAIYADNNVVVYFVKQVWLSDLE
jgi:hypothetical protein